MLIFDGKPLYLKRVFQILKRKQQVSGITLLGELDCALVWFWVFEGSIV